jgi:YD repeat-containing protein
MVAIVSGSSLGVSLTSLATGQNALAGSAVLGRGGQQVLVNSANGNLVLQQNDDHLASTGLDLYALRTYNSQGTFDGDGNDDNWRLGFFRSVDSLTGTVNTIGSTITRIDADGARSLYRHDGVAYIGTEGAGAHDSMTFDAATKQWRWTDGDSRTVETYDWNERSGKLLKQVDASGNAVDFIYTGAQLTEVRDASGESQLLVYEGRNLTQLRTVRLDGTTVTRVRYGYDQQNRLASVVVDLTPEDNSVADGKLYFTAYSYDGDSKRIAGILESDGAQAAFTYQQRGASWVVATVTQVVDGVSRTTAYDYDEPATAAGYITRITDALGNVTLVECGALGRLVRIEGPQIDGERLSIAYSYSTNGDVTSQTDSSGYTTTFGYDSRGNQIALTDATGHTIARTFGSANQVLTEKVSATRPGSIYSNIYDGYRVTQFVYDSRNRLRFTLSDEGRVTEYRYDAAGNRAAAITYTGQTCPAGTASAPTESAMVAWVGAIADRSTTQRTDFGYDFRGQASSVTTWSKVGADGTGIDDGSQNVSRLVHDQAGRLLQSFAASGMVTTSTYDGLGRVLSATDNTGGATTVVYDDEGRRVVTSQAGGLVTTSLYSTAGELTSVLKSDAGGALGQTRMWYDALGNLRVTQDADGAKCVMFYDAAGRQTATMDTAGRVTEYTYDVRGNRTRSIAYATVAATRAFMARAVDLALPENAAPLAAALALELDAVRPAAAAADSKTWNLYDARDRLVWQIDALGFATQTMYDGLSRVVGTNRPATAIDTTKLTDSADLMVNLLGCATTLQVREAGVGAGPNGAHTFVAVLGIDESIYEPSGTVSFFAGAVLLGSDRISSNVATLSVANLPVGQSTITAVYSGDDRFTASAAAGIETLVAAAQPSSVELAASHALLVAGDALTLTATIGGAAPSGMVAFYSGAVVVGYALVKDGAAALTTTALPAGALRLTAAYLGDANHAASTSTAGVSIIVAPAAAGPNAATRIAVSCGTAQPVHGAPVVLRAEVPAAADGGVVVFYGTDGKELGRGLVAAGQASVSVRGLAAGMHAVGAMYLGDGAAGIGIGELDLEVAQADTTVSLTIPPGARPVGMPLMLFANVARPGDGFATGTVTFYSGPTVIGCADLTNGQASLSVSNLPVGANELSVRYGGDASNAASRSESAPQVTINGPFATSMTLASSKTVLAAGDKVVLTASVKGRSGEPLTGIVTFFSTREVLGTAPVVNGVATLEAAYFNTGYNAGTSYAMAAYSGDAANGPSGVTIAPGISVQSGVAKPAPTTTPSTLTFDATPAAVTFGEAVALRVQVGVANSANPATGAVTFFDSTGRVILGSARVIDGAATFNVTALSAASQKIIAVYSGDQFNTATSNATGVSRIVTMKPVVINPVLTASTVGNDRTGMVRLAASVVYPSGQLTALLDGTASVMFYSGNNHLGTATVNNGTAVFDVLQGTINTAEVRAVFRSDSSMLRATGNSAPVQLGFDLPGPGNLKLTTESPRARIGGPLTLSAELRYDYGGSNGTLAGAFTFYDGATVLGTVAGGDYDLRVRLVVKSVSAGEHQYRVVYTPTRPAHGVASSEAISYRADKNLPAPQIAEVALDAQGSAVSWTSPSAVTGKITITVAMAAGAAAPSGKVVLYSELGARLGTVQIEDGKAVFLMPASCLRAGRQSFRAIYEGDQNTAEFEKTFTLDYHSGPNLQTSFDDKIALTSGPDPQGTPGMVELVASVTAADPGGTVAFIDAYGNLLGTSPVEAGGARLVLAMPQGGLSGFKASYTRLWFDNTVSYKAPAVQPGAPSETVLTVSASAVALAAPLTLTARVAGGATGTVDFYDGAILLGKAALVDGVAVLSTVALPAGVRRLIAVYSGDALNASSRSGSVGARVMGYPANVTLVAPAGPVRQGAAVTYTALVEGNMPGGVVTFLNGKTVLGTASVVRGVATLQLEHNAFDTGSVDIAAWYDGDEVHAGAASETVSQRVTAGTRQIAVGIGAGDRFFSSYDDADGNVRMTIDAENFVTEYVYDAANRLVKTITYATPYRAPQLLPSISVSGSFTAERVAQFMPAASAADRSTYFYYDNAGRKVADVNAEGYLSEYAYDKAGRPTETIRYANMAQGPVGGASTPASLRPAASPEDQRTATTWDVRGRMAAQRSADGTVTEFTYDNDNRLTGTTRARGTQDERTTLKRFDSQGMLRAELDGVGAALIAGEQNVAEIDAIWSAHGTSYAYDAVGKLVSATAPLGQRILYFYDDAGQLRHTVNALGEVTQNSHDTLGRLTGVTRYAERVAPAAVAAMTGGLLSSTTNQAAALALQQAFSAGGEQNSVTRLDYDLAGRMVATTDAMHAVRTTAYNAFGEIVAETGSAGENAGALTTLHTLDRRGLETATVQRSDKLYQTASAQYDAFGRAVREVDAVGNVRLAAYDRLGQVIQTTDPAGAVQSATFDAFGRTLSSTDALGAVTRYSYDVAARSNTVTTAEGVAVTTMLTANGQVRSVTDGNGRASTYRYDQNGNVLGRVDALTSSENTYDSVNRLVLSVDGGGHRVAYAYDAASRVLTRTIDPDGASLTTSFAYDALGQGVRVTDPAGIVTATAFDLAGRAIGQTLDADGAASATTYAHDANGNIVSVVQADGARTDFVFDELGRRVKTITDPLGLNLVERFEYDKNGNVASSVDALGNRTLYAYDSLGRLVYTVGPTGIVRQNVYDLQGRVVRSMVYARQIAVSKLGTSTTRAAVAALVVLTGARDVVTHLVYDKDGRVAFEVDGQGGVKEHQYDGTGNVTSTRAYANLIDMAAWVAGTVPSPVADPARDVLVRTVYDALSRPVFTIDARGQVVGTTYGTDGYVSDTIRYANPVAAGILPTMAAVSGALVASARDLHDRFTYDHAGHVLFKADTEGNVVGYSYDAQGNVTRSVDYAMRIEQGNALGGVQESAGDRATLMAYDSENRLVMLMDASGQLQSRAYDAGGRLVRTISFANRVARPTSGNPALSLVAMAALVQASPAHDRMSVTVYDADNREVYSVDADGFVTERMFDAADNVVRRTTYATPIVIHQAPTLASMAQTVAAIADPARDDTMRFVADAAGNTLWSVNAAGDAISYVYTAAGQVASTATYLHRIGSAIPMTSEALAAAVAGVPASSSDDYVYDAANRLAFEIDGSGAVTGHQYDGNGLEIQITVYAARIKRTAFVPGTAPAVVPDPARDSTLRTVHDSMGRAMFTVDRDGFVLETSYSPQGQVSGQVAYGRRIDPQTAMTAQGVGAAVALVADARLDARRAFEHDQSGRLLWESGAGGMVRGFTYDAEGNLTRQVEYALPIAIDAAPHSVVASAGDRATLTAYDVHGRVILTVDPTGRVETIAYDASGNAVAHTTFANLAPAPTAVSAPLDAGFILPAADPINDRVERKVYDDAGRAVFSIDQAGRVVATRYAGNAVETIAYAMAVPPATAADALALTAAVAMVADSSKDNFQRVVHNAAGNATSSTDAQGRVSTFSYDALGNAIETVAPDGGVSRKVYDGHGRVAYSIDPLGFTTGYAYDVAGNLVRQVQFATLLAPNAAPATLDAAPKPDDRVSLMAYDQQGQLVYAVDPEGAVRRQEFDAAGNMTALTLFAGKVNTVALASGAFGVPVIAALVVLQPDADRVSRQVFDSANRLVYSIDPAGFFNKLEYDEQGNMTVQTRYAASLFAAGAFSDFTVAGMAARVVADPRDLTERFEHNAQGQVTWHQDADGKIESAWYNSIGQKIAFTDKNGHEWAYRYDAAGNMVEETAPAVPGKDGVPYRRVTTLAFDALGQVVQRSEAGDGELLVQTFTFDNAGNQLSINFGRVTIYVPGVDAAQPGDAVVTSKSYDLRGNVTRTVDADGYVSRNVYGANGMLRYEIDAKGNVTGYVRNSFGDVTSLVRYEDPISVDTEGEVTASQVAQALGAFDPAKRRTITTTYDRDGRVLLVTQPAAYAIDANLVYSSVQTAGRTSRTSYDAFGAAISEAQLVNASDNTWSISNSYYDQRGNVTAQVDAAGYLTSYTHDFAGRVVVMRESAQAVAGWTGSRLAAPVAPEAPFDARDRVITRQYDGQGRVVRETLLDVTGTPAAEHVRVTEYDGNGNVTLTAAWGPGAANSDAPHRMFYDALGRVTAVMDGSHRVGGGFGLTTYRYNLAGLAVVETRYANGSAGHDSPLPARISVDDRTITTQYDEMGHVIRVVDASGALHYLAYNARGLQTDIWHIGTGAAHAAGAVFGLASRTYDALGRMLTDGGQDLTFQYNAYGEMVRREQAGMVTFWEFDNAGRMWRSNESGVNEVTVYDLLGRKSSVFRSNGQTLVYADNDVMAYASAKLAVNNSTYLNRITYRYDAQGNVVSMTGAERALVRPVSTQVFDRWGNLLSKTEPAADGTANPTTSYTYDAKNRVTSERHAKADGSAGGRVREFIYTDGDQDAQVTRVMIDRESFVVAGPADNDALHARYRVTTDQYTPAGKLLSAATNGIVTERHTYDAFDQLRTDELDPARAVSYAYDHAGHLISVTHQPVEVFGVTLYGTTLSLASEGNRSMVERYDYDELGNMYAYTNGAGDVTRFKHDVRGNVTWTDTPGSEPTSATWDAGGRKLSAVDAFGNSASWTYDSVGRVKTYTGYDGAVTTYAYGNDGLLVSASQPVKGQLIIYKYDTAGQLTEVVDTTAGGNGYQALVRKTSYRYDLAGNRTRETTTQGSTDSDGKTFASNRLVYDALHRLVSVTTLDMGEGAQSVKYEYDAFGNRTKFTSASVGNGAERNQTGYFFYDATNRTLVSGALDALGAVGAQTLRHAYDGAGNLASTVSGGNNTQYGYDAMNRVVSTSVNGHLAFATSYDAAGRVLADAVKSADAPAIPKGMAMPVAPTEPPAPVAPPAGSSQQALDLYAAQKLQYDKNMVTYASALTLYRGQLKDYEDQHGYLARLALSFEGNTYERHLKSYDAQGRLLLDQAIKDNGAVKTMLVNETFDAAGNVLRYRTESMLEDHIRNDYVNTFRALGGGVMQASSSGRMTILSGQMAGDSGSEASSTDVYDANGFLIGVTYSTAGDAPQTGTSNKVFIMDQNGVILLAREQSYNSPTAEQHQIVANGKLQLRFSTSYGAFGQLEDVQKEAFWKSYNASATQSMVSTNSELRAEAGATSTTGQSVIVAPGDTLQSIAARVYGTPDAWYRIADANGLQAGSALIAGSTLVAPAATAASNEIDFDLGKLVGGTAPNLPPPPADKQNCIALVIVVVAVVVACVVAPYMAQAAGAMLGVAAESASAVVLAGAMGGAVANIASQGLGMALDVQDSFEWGAVGMAALAGGMGKAVNVGWIDVSPDAWVNSAVANGMTQKIGVMTGMQEKFSWSGVAGAGVGAMMTQGMANGTFGEGLQTRAGDGFTENFLRGGLSGFASNLTTELINPGKQDWARVATGAFEGGLSEAMAPRFAEKAAPGTGDSSPFLRPTGTLSFADELDAWKANPFEGPMLDSRAFYEDMGTDYVGRLSALDIKLDAAKNGPRIPSWDPAKPAVFVQGQRMTEVEKAAYDLNHALRTSDSSFNPVTVAADVGKYTVGAVEMGGKGLWNEFWRIGGSFAAIPYAFESGDAYQYVAGDIAATFHWENRSQGAKDAMEKIKPYAKSIGASINEARAYSEENFGLGVTTVAFAAGDAAFQLVTTLGPAKFKFGRVESGVAAEVVRGRLVTLTEVANGAEHAAMRSVAAERALAGAAATAGDATALAASRAVAEAAKADTIVGAGGQRAGALAAGSERAAAQAAAAAERPPGLTAGGALAATESAVPKAAKALDNAPRADATPAVSKASGEAVDALDSIQMAADSIHPSRVASHEWYKITRESVLHGLRKAGTVESLAIAKAISKGKLKLNISETHMRLKLDEWTGKMKMQAEPGLNGMFNPLKPNEINIYTNKRMDLEQAIGTVVHEGTHYLQLKQGYAEFNLMHEFRAFRAQGKVDKRTIGAEYKPGTIDTPASGLTDWGLWYYLENHPKYKDLPRGPVRPGQFDTKTDWQVIATLPWNTRPSWRR